MRQWRSADPAASARKACFHTTSVVLMPARAAKEGQRSARRLTTSTMSGLRSLPSQRPGVGTSPIGLLPPVFLFKKTIMI